MRRYDRTGTARERTRLSLAPSLQLLRTMVLLLAMLSAALTARSDTSSLRIREQKDELQFYLLKAVFTTVDTDSSGVWGPPQYPGGTHWSWSVSHRADAWYWGPPPAPFGVSNASITLDGTHLHGPHPSDAPNNQLDLLAPPGEFVQMGDGEFVTETNAVDHPASPEVHRDEYGFGAWICARGDSSQLRLTGDLRIYAQHQSRGHYDGWLKWITFGCNELPVTSVAFDAGSGTLMVCGGRITVLNREGRTDPGIDPLYAGDPLLRSDLWVSQLQYAGPNGDGGYRFGPGFVEVNDPELTHRVSGMFPGYVFYGWSRGTNPHGTGLLTRLSIRDKMAPPVGPSPFLQDFVGTNLFGDGLEEDEWLERTGTAVAIVPVVDLVALSNGFTQSTPLIPAAIVVSCAVRTDESSHVPPRVPHPTFLLANPSPNPMTGWLDCRITLARASRVEARIVDIFGRTVASVLDGHLEAGTHPLRWVPEDRDGPMPCSGVYFLRVRAGGAIETRPVTLLRR